MSVGKKLAVVLSVVIAGWGTASFFQNDGSALWPWSRRSDDPFVQQVERRVGGPPTWSEIEPPRLPLATASISPSQPQPTAPALSPIGSLLPPIEGVAEDLSSGRYNAPTATAYTDVPRDASAAASGAGEIRHRVEDGDTLTSLAVKYLGRADAYQQIYALNRERLTNPDLLPIGAVLRIPVPHRAPAVYRDAEAPLGMVPVPPRP